MSEVQNKEAEILLKRATAASVTVAILLIIIKTWGYYESGSVALLGTLMDSIMDSLSSIIIFAAVRYSMVPADDEHRFGHGKAEAIAGLLQAFVISISALLLFYEVIDKALNPSAIMAPELGIGVVVISIILTFMLVAYQRYVAKKTKSVAIEADGMHYAGDIILNLGVIISLVLGSYFGLTIADPVFGAIAGMYLLYSAYQVFIASTDVLMDKELSNDNRQKIEAIINNHDRVVGVHQLRTRRSGLNIFIQFHMEFERDISLYDAHQISDQVEGKILNVFPNAEIFIHADPYNDGKGKL